MTHSNVVVVGVVPPLLLGLRLGHALLELAFRDAQTNTDGPFSLAHWICRTSNFTTTSTSFFAGHRRQYIIGYLLALVQIVPIKNQQIYQHMYLLAILLAPVQMLLMWHSTFGNGPVGEHRNDMVPSNTLRIPRHNQEGHVREGAQLYVYHPTLQETLCRAWLHASLDPIVGNDQKAANFY
jgi:hypothetical protein